MHHGFVVLECVKVVGLEEEKKAEEEKDVKGVPQFWLTIFKNVEMIADMIQEADEPALETLKDVTLTFSEVRSTTVVVGCVCICTYCTIIIFAEKSNGLHSSLSLWSQ